MLARDKALAGHPVVDLVIFLSCLHDGITIIINKRPSIAQQTNVLNFIYEQYLYISCVDDTNNNSLMLSF